MGWGWACRQRVHVPHVKQGSTQILRSKYEAGLRGGMWATLVHMFCKATFFLLFTFQTRTV